MSLGLVQVSWLKERAIAMLACSARRGFVNEAWDRDAPYGRIRLITHMVNHLKGYTKMNPIYNSNPYLLKNGRGDASPGTNGRFEFSEFVHLHTPPAWLWF